MLEADFFELESAMTNNVEKDHPRKKKEATPTTMDNMGTSLRRGFPLLILAASLTVSLFSLFDLGEHSKVPPFYASILAATPNSVYCYRG